MKNENYMLETVQKEFAFVDSIMKSHTNLAIAKVNAEQLQMYWEVGGFISRHLADSSWGDHVVSELSDFLKRQDTKRKGCSKRNLYNMVRFYETYSSPEFSGLIEQLELSEFVQSQTAQISASPIVQLSTAQLQMPAILSLSSFTAHIEILNRCRTFEQYIFYILYSAEQHI